MDINSRAYVYLFLSRIFSNCIDKEYLEDLYSNDQILQMIGSSTVQWFNSIPKNEILELLNIDFSSVVLIANRPFESTILDCKDEVLVGLQNPVMQFYYDHNYQLNLTFYDFVAPDHMSVEFAFMENLIRKDDVVTQKEFLQNHLVFWSVPYLLSIQQSFQTPFYRDICDLAIEFLCTDFEFICNIQ